MHLLHTVPMPDYDGLYNKITMEIEKWQPALVSWLTPQEKTEALNAPWKPFPSIESMKIPSSIADITYPEVIWPKTPNASKQKIILEIAELKSNKVATPWEIET